jgi:hypothetical protein
MAGQAVNCEQHVTFSSVVLSVPFAPTLILPDCCKLVDHHLNGNARHRRKPDGGSGGVESRLLIGSVHRFFVVAQVRVLLCFISLNRTAALPPPVSCRLISAMPLQSHHQSLKAFKAQLQLMRDECQPLPPLPPPQIARTQPNDSARPCGRHQGACGCRGHVT